MCGEAAAIAMSYFSEETIDKAINDACGEMKYSCTLSHMACDRFDTERFLQHMTELEKKYAEAGYAVKQEFFRRPDSTVYWLTVSWEGQNDTE